MSKLKIISLCVLAMACIAEATPPTLSISRVPPSTLRFSWPSNFVDWHLTSTTNLSLANWQAVTQASFLSNNSLVVLFPYTNSRGFFRLEQTNGSGCVFQATPPVINSGQSSTLMWCPVAGVTYRLFPGPGIVPGGSLIVTPPATTVYTLTASNALGITTNYATVIVNPCGFANVTNWEATLDFTYALAPSAPGYSFNVNRQAHATFHLTRTSASGLSQFTFDGIASGNTSINDREDDTSSGTLITTTTIGSGPPEPSISTFVLFVDCTSYTFSAIVAVNGIDTETSLGITSSSSRIPITGQVFVGPYSLQATNSTLSGSTNLPVLGPFTVPTGNYYTPNDVIANDMWVNGVITDATAGTANVSWSFTPVP